MLHKLRFLIIGTLMVVASAGASYAAVSASMPSALLAAGTARFATAASSTSESVYPADGWVDLPGMTKYITIPGGMTAEVMVTFCSQVWTDPNSAVHVRAMVRDTLASPAEFILIYSHGTWSSQCATFYKTNVTAGSPAVKLQWRAVGPAGAFTSNRSMVVVVNIH